MSTEADAAMDALAGPNEFGLTQPQVESIRVRLGEVEGSERAHSVTFERQQRARQGYSYGGETCCDVEMLIVNGLRPPIEHFKAKKEPVCTGYVCSHCGEIKK